MRKIAKLYNVDNDCERDGSLRTNLNANVKRKTTEERIMHRSPADTLVQQV